MYGASFYLKKFIAGAVLPPAGPVLVALLGVLLLKRRPRLGRTLIVLSAVSTLLLSTQIVSSWLLSTLQVARPLNPNAIPPAQAIVVLAGGIRRQAVEYGARDEMNDFTMERLRYGAWLAKRTGLPVLVSGGLRYAPSSAREADIMANALQEDYGLHARWVENESRDTAENAINSARILKSEGVTTVLLVTHAWHMRRALAAFGKTHLQSIGAPTRFASPSAPRFLSFIPSGRGYEDSAFALHEWLGYAWFQARGLFVEG